MPAVTLDEIVGRPRTKREIQEHAASLKACYAPTGYLFANGEGNDAGVNHAKAGEHTDIYFERCNAVNTVVVSILARRHRRTSS